MIQVSKWFIIFILVSSIVINAAELKVKASCTVDKVGLSSSNFFDRDLFDSTVNKQFSLELNDLSIDQYGDTIDISNIKILKFEDSGGYLYYNSNKYNDTYPLFTSQHGVVYFNKQSTTLEKIEKLLKNKTIMIGLEYQPKIFKNDTPVHLMFGIGDDYIKIPKSSYVMIQNKNNIDEIKKTCNDYIAIQKKAKYQNDKIVVYIIVFSIAILFFLIVFAIYRKNVKNKKSNENDKSSNAYYEDILIGRKEKVKDETKCTINSDVEKEKGKEFLEQDDKIDYEIYDSTNTNKDNKKWVVYILKILYFAIAVIGIIVFLSSIGNLLDYFDGNIRMPLVYIITYGLLGFAVASFALKKFNNI